MTQTGCASAVQFETAIKASRGARSAQEDTALAWPIPVNSDDAATLVALPSPEPGVVAAVLCDGMGGHIGGAMASRLACEHFLPSFLAGEGATRTRLLAALDRANTAIADKVARDQAYKGMGATLVGVYAGVAGLSWVSVGDSLLYLWRQGQIRALNEDHSLAPEIDKLAESGKISWQEARDDPRRHYLRAALTGEDIELVDADQPAIRLQAGDVIIVASDGIHTLAPDAIARIIAERQAEGAHALASNLIASVEARDQPHQDNTTIVVIRVRSTPPPPGNV